MTDTPDPTIPRTVVALTVDSFQRIRAARVEPSPDGLVLVRGRNGQGKSSLLGSMLDAFGAERSELPITEGQHAGEVRVDLGDLVVVEKLTRDDAGKAKRRLVVEGKEGERYGSPAAVLKALRSHFADPLAFEQEKPAEQVKTVLRVLGLDEDLARLEGQAEALFEQRRDLGRDADRTTKALLQLEAEAKADPAPEGSTEDPDELQAELANAHAHNRKRASFEEQLRRAAEDGPRLARELQELADRLEEIRVSKAKAAERWKEANAELEALGAPIETLPIEQRIAAVNKSQTYRARARMIEDAKRASDHAGALHKAKEDELEAKRAEINELLRSTPFPVEGMSYDPETKSLTIGGVPFSQASQAERLRAAAAVAMAGEPSIRVLFVREGSLLDEESLALLDSIARERHFQIWTEVVDSKREGVGLYIEDGEVFSDDDEPRTAAGSLD